MTNQPFPVDSRGAEVASGRAALYDFFVRMFDWLPDRDLLLDIRRGHFQEVFVSCCELGDVGFRDGLKLIASYRSKIADREDEEVLAELAVDRTRILRGTGHAGMLPPYEAIYRRNRESGNSILEVKRFYRKAGILPDETVLESLDYLCVELDFMKQLCLREQELRLKGEGFEEVVLLEEEFLRLHLGGWVGEFCRAIAKHALTNFYRAIGHALDAFIRTERQWLGQKRAS